MEQFRQLGEVLGSLKALMVFRDNIQINQRQCVLLHDMFCFAYKSISEEMRENLKFEERNNKWKVLEMPLKELLRVFKEGEVYIRQSLESKDWWAKAITLYQNSDCVELHIHNLLSCIPVVIEAIEIAAEFSGLELDDMQKKRRVYSSKYHKEWIDPQIFQWKFAKQYLVTQDFCNRIERVTKEDRWILLNKILEKKNSSSRKQERKLADLLLRNIDDNSESLNRKLLPSSILLGSKEYQVRRRLGTGSKYKEVYWLGESFVLRQFFGDVEEVAPEISSLLSLSHPNILHYLCGFTDDDKKECLLVMELMNKSLCIYLKETCGPRKRVPFSLAVAVDLMLQIARGMEYLHSNKTCHGELNTSNIHVKSRGMSSEGYVHAKVSGFGLSSIVKLPQKSTANQNETESFIWHAPEVLEEQEVAGSNGDSKYTEKADVYSFGMICFQLLTGKVPFEDSHLQGDKMSRNIRAGERPLFPFQSQKSLTNLTKRCWHSDPNLRPSFPSICRILRYVKRCLLMNPDYNNQTELPMPMVDYCEIDSRLQRKFPTWEASNPSSTSSGLIPFQMFVYRVLEKEKIGATLKDTSESGSDRTSVSGDEILIADDPILPPVTERRFFPSTEATPKRLSALKKSQDIRPKHPGNLPRSRQILSIAIIVAILPTKCIILEFKIILFFFLSRKEE